MGRHAKRPLFPLNKVAVLDPATISVIAEQVSGQTVDVSGKVDKVTGKSLVFDTEIAKIHTSGSDNQDLSGLQPKETGKGLSTNDYTTGDKDKLTAVPIIKVSATEPQNPQVNDIWIDIS